MRIKKTSETSTLIGQVVNSNSDSTTDTYSCDYANKAFGGKVLWTNPNPTSGMNADTEINLSSGDYDMYEIIYSIYGGSSEALLSTGKIPKGNATNLIGMGYPGQGISAWYRGISRVNDTTLKVTTCRGMTTTTTYDDNAKNIPLYIIGYKTGLFS